MKLAELREIAKARMSGHLTALSVSVQETQTDDSGKRLAVMVYDDAARKEDMKFIATMANHIDALLDVVEAALEHLPYIASGDLFGAGKYSEHNVSAHKLREALKKLEEIK